MKPHGRFDAQAEHAIVLIDGVCHLCQGLTRFIIRHDLPGYFRFASLQSPVGRQILAQQGLTSVPEIPDTIIVIENGQVYVRSEAVVRIAMQLSMPWKLAAVLRFFPRSWRDRAYRYIARNRYRFFGRDDTCMVPTQELKERFLDLGEPR
ncbi:thiol-disulfide oxidoreductase DCC [Paenibacillus sp. CAA11]|uniref:thiol-disulfide oxidoreductase DCC family protein n=1 Tax=Paenibacillus sp. CAA11 TaxID=1532905 RepID=UPI000D36D6E6|nr:thiol-disulfide oxidoreductase DCC family protein [Paenibacillus sp. CAA11]AWB43832.1 thiol-disulfide oxidoreductase DCC [Paenibacillus sp. CAA11]